MPYTDESLRGPMMAGSLIRRRAEAGVIGFGPRARALVGWLAVEKAGNCGAIPRVVDARLPNALHKVPPYVDLPTAGAFAKMVWPLPRLSMAGDVQHIGLPFAQLDLIDSFYKFIFDNVASFYCINFRVRAGDYGINSTLR